VPRVAGVRSTMRNQEGKYLALAPVVVSESEGVERKKIHKVFLWPEDVGEPAGGFLIVETGCIFELKGQKDRPTSTKRCGVHNRLLGWTSLPLSYALHMLVSSTSHRPSY